MLDTVDHQAERVASSGMDEVRIRTFGGVIVQQHGFHHVHGVERVEVSAISDGRNGGVHFVPLSCALNAELRG